jgi:multicomponent Na+:H+ antiporter subunit F
MTWLQAVVSTVMLPLLMLAALLVFIRLLRGPSLPDRVLALDLLSTIGIGIIAVYVVVTGESAILDVATVLAIITFVGTIAFATHIERRV